MSNKHFDVHISRGKLNYSTAKRIIEDLGIASPLASGILANGGYTRLLIEEIKKLQSYGFIITEMDYEVNEEENPPITPIKRKSKEKYWSIILLDNNKNIIRTLVQPFRTKTLAKEFARNAIGKVLGAKTIDSVYLEGPFNKITEASKSQMSDETIH